MPARPSRPRRPSLLWLLAAAPLLFAAGAAVGPGSLRFADFSIDPLPASPPDRTQIAVHMFLAPDGDFAPNVNVVRQPWAGTLKDYAETTTAEMERLGMKLLELDAQPDALHFRYEGVMQGRNLRFDARAFLRGGIVLLATAAATPAQWEEHGDALRASLNSFRAIP